MPWFGMSCNTCCHQPQYHLLSVQLNQRAITNTVTNPNDTWQIIRDLAVSAFRNQCDDATNWQTVEAWRISPASIPPDLQPDGFYPVHYYGPLEALNNPWSQLHDSTRWRSTDWFNERSHLGHAYSTAGGILYDEINPYTVEIDPIGGTPLRRDGCGASMQSAVWIWYVNVEDGQSLASQLGYDYLRFTIRLSAKLVATATGYGPSDLPANLMQFGEWNQPLLRWEPTGTTPLNVGSFRVVCGNAAGNMELFSSTPLRQANHWITRHILDGDYVELDQFTPQRTNATTDIEIIELSRTTLVDDPVELQEAGQYGRVWWIGIIPAVDPCQAGLQELPTELPYIGNRFFSQLWRPDNTLYSCQVARLVGSSPRGEIVFCPVDDKPIP